MSTYVEGAAAQRRDALAHLRDLCREPLLHFEEVVEYGGPCSKRNGEVEVGFASRKNFVGLYMPRTDVINAHGDKLKSWGSAWERCDPQFQSGKIDFDVVESMLRDTIISTNPVC